MLVPDAVQTEPKAGQGRSERDRVRLTVAAERFITAAFTTRENNGVRVIDAA